MFPERPATAQASDGLKSSLSKFLRRDNKAGPSEAKTLRAASSVCDLRAQPSGTSTSYAEVFGQPSFEKSGQTIQSKKSRSRSIVRASSSKSPLKPPPTNPVFPSSPNLVKPSGPNPYRCILCQEQLSSKGVCKRHLDEQHVTPKIYKCEKCQERFIVKKEAKTHVNACGGGVFLYTVEKQDGKNFYACEFTGDGFVSKSKYVDHLLRLSEKTENRPAPNPRLKLSALLDQPGLQQQVAEISSRKFESRHAWRKLQWNDAHVTKAIKELEDADVRESGMIDFKSAQPQKTVRVYLNSLFGAANLPRSNSQHSERSRSSTATQRRCPHGSEEGRATPTQHDKLVMQPPWNSHSLIETSRMDYSIPAPAPEVTVPTIASALRNKRPLSDQSRAFVPERQPHGRPLISQYPYAIGPGMPELQFGIPNIPMTTLPLRTQEASSLTDQSASDVYSMRTASTATPTLSSDAASETTLMSNFPEPELVEQLPMDYNYPIWTSQQNPAGYFNFPGGLDYSNMAVSQMLYANTDPSARTSSIATDQTCVGDYNGQDHKFPHFEPYPPQNSTQYRETFLLDGDDDYHDSHGLS